MEPTGRANARPMAKSGSSLEHSRIALRSIQATVNAGAVMTIAEWCVFASVMLYLLSIAPIKSLGLRQFDHANPPDTAFYDSPLRARAWGAHQNGIEAFPFFAAAVLLAEFRIPPPNPLHKHPLLFLILPHS